MNTIENRNASPSVTNDNVNTFQTFIDTLSTETGIDTTSATKVATWLKNEGVLDFPVLNETYNSEGVRD